MLLSTDVDAQAWGCRDPHRFTTPLEKSKQAPTCSSAAKCSIYTTVAPRRAEPPPNSPPKPPPVICILL